MRAVPEAGLLAVGDDKGVDAHAIALPHAHAARNGLALEARDALAVGHDGVRKDHVLHVRKVEPREALLEAELEDAAAQKLVQRVGGGNRVS